MPASGVRRSWLTQVTSSRRALSSARSRSRPSRMRAYAWSRARRSVSSSAKSGPEGGVKSPWGVTASTAATRLLPAFTTRLASTNATPRPTTPAIATTVSTMFLGRSSIAIARMIATTPASVAATVITATTASITPIDRSRSSHSTASPTPAISSPSPAVTRTICPIIARPARTGTRPPRR
jgi:hypothetical protein